MKVSRRLRLLLALATARADDSARTVRIDYRPVHTYTMTNDVAYIPPKERVY